MKYQIILESEELLDDQSFEEFFKFVFSIVPKEEPFIRLPLHIGMFKLLYARSLEGIRKEVYERKEELKQEIKAGDLASMKIDEKFEELDDLFKLN